MILLSPNHIKKLTTGFFPWDFFQCYTPLETQLLKSLYQQFFETQRKNRICLDRWRWESFCNDSFQLVGWTKRRRDTCLVSVHVAAHRNIYTSREVSESKWRQRTALKLKNDKLLCMYAHCYYLENISRDIFSLDLIRRVQVGDAGVHWTGPRNTAFPQKTTTSNCIWNMGLKQGGEMIIINKGKCYKPSSKGIFYESGISNKNQFEIQK